MAFAKINFSNPHKKLNVKNAKEAHRYLKNINIKKHLNLDNYKHTSTTLSAKFYLGFSLMPGVTLEIEGSVRQRFKRANSKKIPKRAPLT